jgi:hypothetical protein
LLRPEFHAYSTTRAIEGEPAAKGVVIALPDLLIGAKESLFPDKALGEYDVETRMS